MMDSLDQRLRASVATPAGEFDADDVARRAGRLRRRRRFASSLGVVMVVAVVAVATVSVWDGDESELAFDDGGEAQTFARPEPGEVVAITAPDGEPAFLVGHEDGAKAFRAVEPLPLGMRELVVWCRPAETFFTPFAGSEWTIDGHYLGGPAPGNLVPYRTDVDGGEVLVGRVQPRPERAADPSTRSLEACRGQHVTGPGNTDTTAASFPVDPQVTVSHAYADEEWPSLEQALATVDEPTSVNVRLTLTGGAGRPFRACSDPASDPPRCPDDAPVVDDLERADEEFPWLLWGGYARVDTDGTTITGFDYWVTVTRREGESRKARQRQRELEQERRQLGPDDRVIVADEQITVPAVDLDYGNPPAQPISAGTYQLTLENHGGIDHTLVNDDLDLDLATSSQPGQLTDTTTVELSPGRYTFYCRVPGHRDAGMEFDVVVEQASP